MKIIQFIMAIYICFISEIIQIHEHFFHTITVDGVYLYGSTCTSLSTCNEDTFKICNYVIWQYSTCRSTGEQSTCMYIL